MSTLDGSANASCGYTTDPTDVREPPDPAPVPETPGWSAFMTTSGVSRTDFWAGDTSGHVSPLEVADEAAQRATQGRRRRNRDLRSV